MRSWQFLGGLWASQRQETNYVSGICMHCLNFLADGQGHINSAIDPNHEYMYFSISMNILFNEFSFIFTLEGMRYY